MRYSFAAASLALTAALFSNSAMAAFPTIYYDSTAGFGNSPWSYGTTGTSKTGAFTEFTTFNSGTDYSYYSSSVGAGWGVGQASSSGYQEGDAFLNGGAVGVNPSASYAAIKFTAQVGGDYYFNGLAFAAAANTSADTHIIYKGVDVGGGLVTGPAYNLDGYQTLAFNTAMHAGDSIYFLVGNGGSLAGNGGSDLVDLSIGVGVFNVQTPVPEPSTYAMLSVGLLALGVAARRRRGGSV